jgi:hypothetical protein
VQLRAASRKDVLRFIKERANCKDHLIVEVDPARAGDCWADMLEGAGFQVVLGITVTPQERGVLTASEIAGQQKPPLIVSG